MSSKRKLISALNKDIELDSKSFFESFGGLHDSEVFKICYERKDSVLIIEIEDFYSNFLGLPEYQDLKDVILCIKIDKKLDINIDLLDSSNLSIYDVLITANSMKILFAPSGFIELSFSDIRLMDTCN